MFFYLIILRKIKIGFKEEQKFYYFFNIYNNLAKIYFLRFCFLTNICVKNYNLIINKNQKQNDALFLTKKG